MVVPGHPQHVLRVRYATEHRCGVVISGPGLCNRVSGTDPLKDGLPLQACRPACLQETVRVLTGRDCCRRPQQRGRHQQTLCQRKVRASNAGAGVES